MHDFHLANEILKTVLEYAQKNNLKSISKISIELGSIVEHGEEVSPENLQYNFKLLAKGTQTEKSRLFIKKTKRGFWKLKEIEGTRA